MRRVPAKKCAAGKDNGARYTLADGITQGLLSDFTDCRKRAEYRCAGWHSEGRRGALEFGTLMHRLLEVWYGDKPTPKNQEKAFAQVALEHTTQAKQDGTDLAQAENELGIALPLFRGYVKHWAKQDAGRRWVELEDTFDVPYQTGWGTYRLRGRCDGVYEKNGLWLFETKTKSQLQEESFTQALSFDFQNLFYLIAKGTQLARQFSGVGYNIIRTPQIRIGKDETVQDYRERLAQDIAARPDFYYVRYEVVYLKSRMEWARQELDKKLRMYHDWVDGKAPTVANQAACTGKWNCAYLGACASNSMAGYVRDEKFTFRELED